MHAQGGYIVLVEYEVDVRIRICSSRKQMAIPPALAAEVVFSYASHPSVIFK
jgi:hypothetical protein